MTINLDEAKILIKRYKDLMTHGGAVSWETQLEVAKAEIMLAIYEQNDRIIEQNQKLITLIYCQGGPYTSNFKEKMKRILGQDLLETTE